MSAEPSLIFVIIKLIISTQRKRKTCQSYCGQEQMLWKELDLVVQVLKWFNIIKAQFVSKPLHIQKALTKILVRRKKKERSKNVFRFVFKETFLKHFEYLKSPVAFHVTGKPLIKIERHSNAV